MKFIKLHNKIIELNNETTPVWVNVNAIEMIEPASIEKSSSVVFLNGFGYYFDETPEEVLEKIVEAEQRELEKIAEAEQSERSFMDDWKDEVDDQLSRLTVKKDGATDATDRW